MKCFLIFEVSYFHACSLASKGFWLRSESKFRPACLKFIQQFYKLCILTVWKDSGAIQQSSNTIKTKVKNDHRSKFSNLSNWKEEAWKNQDFNGIRTRELRDTGAMLYQLSYEATHWERGQFIEFISPVGREMIWSIYEIIHIFELRL